MKHSFFLTFILSLMLVGIGYCQNAVSLSSVQGLVAPNKLAVNRPVKFVFQYQVNIPDPDAWRSCENGFKLYSPDGATWGQSTQSWIPGSLPFAAWGQSNFRIVLYGVDGLDADTIGFLEATRADAQIINITEDLIEISSSGFSVADVGKTFCIDSTSLPGGVEWAWWGQLGPLPGHEYKPSWGGGPYASNYTPSGGYCFTLAPPPYICGDINDDPQQKINVHDIIFLVKYFFESGANIPIPIDRANVDCSADPNPNILDLTYLINYFFNGGSVPCSFSSQNAFNVQIEKTHNTLQGEHELVDVSLQTGLGPIGGFNFLIAYNSTDLPAALTLTNVQPGSPLFDSSECGWEYFTFSNSTFGPCGNACAINKVRVTGIADINNGNQHPNCYFPDMLPSTLFTFDFLVSTDPMYICQYTPVRFVWFDCQDNTITNRQGDRLFLSREVRDFELIGTITDSTIPYPTFTGAHSCASMSPATLRFIDFNSGGVDIHCVDSIALRGDVNLNGIRNEVVDANLFTSYFFQGLAVFTVDLEKQMRATNANADDTPLGVADLVYLWGIVHGIFIPFPSPVASMPPAMNATYTISNGQISIDSTVAAAFIVVAGNVTPISLADSMEVGYQFDGTNTNILLFDQWTDSFPRTFTGPFLNIGSATVISAEFSTPLGGVVNATRVDAK